MGGMVSRRGVDRWGGVGRGAVLRWRLKLLGIWEEEEEERGSSWMMGEGVRLGKR